MSKIIKLILAVVIVLQLCACNKTKESKQKEVRAKVGQLFMLAFTGEDPEIVLPLIKDRGIGALYLSNDNLNDPERASKLLNILQEGALQGISGQPLLTAADQEGAWAVLTPHSASGPGNMALGGAPSSYTRKMYSTFATEMTAVGVFCNLAPCADVNSNPLNPIIGTRSFGENPHEVAIRVSEAVKGLHDGHMIATAKHFPGHGNTATDSHSGLPVVDRSKEEIDSIDILPFKAAIDAGVDMVMTAHIVYSALDADNPATLSSKILNNYLRDTLGFKGVVITDSFNMWAIQKNYSPQEAAVKAILAGADMIMLAEERYGESVGDYVSNQIKILDRVEQAVLSGEIPMERLDEAYNRIINMKNKYQLSQRLPIDPNKAVSIVGSEPTMAVALEAASHSVHVLYDQGNVLPLSSEKTIAVVRLARENVKEIMAISEGIGPNYANGFRDFVKELNALGYRVNEYEVDDDIEEDIIIAVGENYPLPGKSLDLKVQLERLQLLNEKKKTLINVALKDPYDALHVKADVYVCAVGSNYSNAVAAARLITGKLKSSDRLAVTPIVP